MAKYNWKLVLTLLVLFMGERCNCMCLLQKNIVEIPRSEYPRPQFERADWLCLNGQWEFEIDSGDSGLERGLLKRSLNSKIIVPFCPESKLSGVENTDFMNAVWYRKIVTIPADWTGKDVLLHFQAVDYDTTVWVNAKEVARHTGGWTGFECNLTSIVEPGKRSFHRCSRTRFQRQYEKAAWRKAVCRIC
jgi:beta-galactosidase/beta-glucuronidase